MSKDIKIYILAVVLPAILLVAGGTRLIALEAGRARAGAIRSLDIRAAKIVRDVHARLGRRDMRGKDPACHPPAKPAPPPCLRHTDRRRPVECKRHDLPPEVRKAIIEALEANRAAHGDEIVAEVRHACGCVVIRDTKPILGRITGHAALGHFAGEYSIVTARIGGDAEVALGIRTQVAFTAILILLFAGTLAAGVTLLAKYARKAQKEAREKTNFISNISHELKTPLTSIRMFSEMIASGALAGESLEKAGATLAKESTRLGRQIESLLEYSRLEHGTRKFDFTSFNLRALLCEAADAIAPSFDVKPSVACDAAIEVHTDREALRRILDCILENAAKYALRERPVEIKAATEGGKVSIDISDSGPGMSASDALHCFERFWRSDNSVTRSTGGTGLGLAIARSLARAMGASLSLAHYDGYCTFTITLESANG